MAKLPFVYDRDILFKKDLTRDDILGTGIFGGAVMSGDVKCIKCDKFRVSGITVCMECIEYMCDKCINDGKECCGNMHFEESLEEKEYQKMKQEYIENLER